MIALRAALLCLLALLAFPAAVSAAPSQAKIWEAQSEAVDTRALEREAEPYLKGVELKPEIDLDGGLALIWNRMTGHLTAAAASALRSGVLLMMVVLLCGLVDAVRAKPAEGVDAVRIGGALGITALAGSDLNLLSGLGSQAVASMDTFSKVLLPVMTASAAAAGNPSGAAARQVATMLFSDLLITLIGRLLLPVVYGYVAVSMAASATGNRGLNKVAGLLKWISKTALVLLLTVYVGYLTVSGAIAGAADLGMIKAAKFTIAGAVPVVGGILGDAAEAVVAGAGILRNAVGVFGLLTVLAICVVPFLELAVHYLVYKTAAALSSTLANGGLADLIESIGGAFGMVLGMTGASAILLLLSIVSAITATTG